MTRRRGHHQRRAGRRGRHNRKPYPPSVLFLLLLMAAIAGYYYWDTLQPDSYPQTTTSMPNATPTPMSGQELIATTPRPAPTPTATPTPTPDHVLTGPTPPPTPTPTAQPASNSDASDAPSAIRASESVWECFVDRPNIEVTPIPSVAGCSGWNSDTINKWEKDSLEVYVEPQGDERYRELALEALEYLSPVLRLDFVYGTSEHEADLRVYAGVPSSWYAAIGMPAYCGTQVSGCGGADWISGDGAILQATFSAWYNADADDDEIKHVVIHEALHALTTVDHSTDFSSIMSENSTLRLPYLLPWEEAMYRLYSDPRIAPGMSVNEVKELVEVAGTDPGHADAEQSVMAAVDGYLRFVESDAVRFQAAVRFLDGSCEVHNYRTTVTQTGSDRYGYKRVEWSDISSAQTNVDFDIELLLIHVARTRTAVATGTDDGVTVTGMLPDYGLLDASLHTGYALDYEVMLDEEGYVQSFRMDWDYQAIGNHCAPIRVVGSSFIYE